VRILENNIKQADYVRNVWAATPPHGTTMAEVQAPDYWLHATRMFRPGDRIEVTPESNEWFVELLVRAKDDTGIKLAVLRSNEFDPPVAAPSEKAEFYAAFGGGDKWRVVRNADKKVVAKGYSSRAEAEAWVSSNTSALV
jgi:hypothetical protein